MFPIEFMNRGGAEDPSHHSQIDSAFSVRKKQHSHDHLKIINCEVTQDSSAAKMADSTQGKSSSQESATTRFMKGAGEVQDPDHKLWYIFTD